MKHTAIKSLLLVSMLATAAASNAAATVLKMDGSGTTQDLTPASYQGAGDTYKESGYTLSFGAGQHFDSVNSSGLFFHDGSANDHWDNWARLTADNGSLFNLSAFTFGQGWGGEIRTNLNSSIQSFAAGAHSVNLAGVKWVEFSAIGNGQTGQNYLYLKDVAVAPVPEPETYALMGMGLVGLLAARRRKVKQA